MTDSRALVVMAVAVIVACESPAPQTTPQTTPQAAARAEPAEQPPTRGLRLEGGNIVTDTFDLKYDLRDGRLALALRSDLSDDTHLMVSVSRVYQERGSPESYPIDYFSESTTIGAWREPRTITIDNARWKRLLHERQQMMARAGDPFTVSRVANTIEISFTVPVNQDPPFTRWNANLVGSVVSQSGNFRLVERDIEVSYPIDASNVGQTRFADPLNLAVGSTYAGSEAIPLAPEVEPNDPIAAIAAIERLNVGTRFTVLQRVVRGNTPWYHVRVDSREGWINSTALLGQQIEVIQ